MDNIAFIPRDDMYDKKKDNLQDEAELKSSANRIEQEQIFERASSNHLQSQASDENKTTQESVETVFKKLDEDKTDSITDSTIFQKQTIEVSSLNSETTVPLPVPVSKKQPTESMGQVKSSVYSTDDSRLSRRRKQASNVFPVGCMGCKDEHPHNNQVPKTESIQEAVRRSNENINDLQKVEERPLNDKNTLQETRRRMIKRKDGNPLLGVGYDDSPPAYTTTTCKIPPGGFSHGLW